MKNYLVIISLLLIFDIKAQNYYDDPFNVGDLGPGGGVIFYEKADWTDGWKYLEAADEKWLNGVPTESGHTIDWTQEFGTSSSTYNSTVNTLGYGDQNTYNTASYNNNRNNLMFNNVYGNVRGWFLPSLNEAYELYDYKLVDNSVLNLENAIYYTSSTNPGNVNVAWTLDMSNRYHGYSEKGTSLRKRAIRKVKLNDVKNRDNKSLHFDSVTDGLMITDSDDFATSSVADRNYMFWINPMTSGFILSKYKHLDAANSDFYIRYQADTQQIQFTGNGTDVMLFGTVPLNQWSFIAITVVDGLVKGYVDGVLKASANLSFSDNTQQQQLYIGATPDIKNLDNTGWENNSFTGHLDDLSVWWQIKPQSGPVFVESEILSYKSISPLGVERQLAGYWNFDEGFDNISTFGTVYNSTVGTSSPELSSVVSFDYAKAPTDLGFYTDDSTPLSQTITFNNDVGENYVVSELRATDLDTDNLTVTFDSNSGQTNNNSDFSISGSQLIMPNTTTHGTYNVDLITSDGQRQLRKRVVVNVVDNVVPTISILASNGSSTVSDGSTIKDNTLYFTFTVSETTTTFTIEDISVSGGTLSNFSGSGTSYTVTFIPSSDGAFALDVDAGVFTDAAGNNNVQSSEFNWNLDSTGPITAITANGAINSILDGSASNDTIVTLTFTINETTTDFTAEDITISGGTLSGFSGSGTQYIVYVFPDVEGDLTIDIDPSLFTDALGNGNSVADQFNWIYDITKPGMVITVSDGANTISNGSATNDAIVNLTFTSNEVTTDFVVEDVLVSGGTLSNFSGSGLVYTANFTPTAEGVITIDIDPSVFTDAAGNTNTVADRFSWTQDITKPTITIEVSNDANTISNGSTTNDAIVNLTFTSNEVTTDFVVEDVLVSGGTLSNFSGSGLVYTANFTPTAEGVITIDIDPSVFTDAAGNGNTAADQFKWTHDVTKPTIAIEVSNDANTISNGSTTNQAIMNLTFTSNEVTTDFTVEDVMVSGGTLSEFSGSGSIYTAIFTPTTQGSMVIDIDPSVFTDAAGNGNTAADQFKWTYDITLPNVAFKIDATGSSENLSATIIATMDKVSTSNTYINFAASGTAVINQDYESTFDLTNKFSVVAGGNGIGNNTNQLSGPEQVAVDSKGNVYVVQEDNTVRKWMYGALNGQIIDGFGESSPMTNIKIDDSDNIFILHLNGIIKKYNSDFSLLSTYQAPPTGYQYYAFDIVNDDESAYIIDFSVDAVLYKTTVSSSTAVMNTSSHFAEGLAIYDDQNIFVVGNNMSLSRYNMSTKESNSYFDYQNCRDIALNSEKNLVVTSDVVLSYSGSPGLLREIVLDESFNIKKEITLLTKQDFYNSNNIAVNESGLTQSGYEEIGISGVAQDVVGNYHLSLSKSSSRFGTNFDNTLEDRVIKYQTSPIIEITAGELQGSIMFKGIEDQLFSEGIKTIILTPSAINATLASTNAITIYLLDNSFTFSPVIAADTFSLAENSPNSTVVGIIEASDADGDTLTYSIINGNSNQAFDLGSTTGQLTVADSTALDFEMTPVFSLLIKVSDGALSDSATFTINLTDVDEDSTTTNQAPTITAATYSLAENSANATVVGTIQASDADGDTLIYSILSGNTGQAFGLESATGILSVVDSSALDYETTPLFSLLVQASDGALSDSATVTINLTDVDETINQPPSLSDATFSIAENSPNSTLVVTLEASDINNDTLTYSIISGNTDQAFGLDASTGGLTVANNVALDFETTPIFSLIVQVSDGALSDSATVTINLTDVDEDSTTTNQAPTITAATYSLAENSVNGTVLGTVEASDPDGDTLTYTIVSGNDAEAFSLDSESGELTVSTSSALDFETTPAFNLAIQVSDGALSDSATVTINLTDVDETTLSLADASAMIYPNPTDGIVNIKMAAFKEATIYNLSGKRIMRSTDNRIDVSSLSEGVYIIKLENRSGDRFSTRLIKE